MEFVSAGWCTKKWLRFDQTITNLTSVDADCFGQIPEHEGASQQPALMGSCLTMESHMESHAVTCGSPVYLVVDESRPRPCVLWPLMIGLMLVLLTFFDMVSMVFSIVSWCYSREWVWNLRTKLCCIASVKWNVSSL